MSDTRDLAGAADAGESIEASNWASESTLRCRRSNNSGVGVISRRFREAKTLSNDWQTASMSVTLTALAAPFKLWAERKMVSRTLFWRASVGACSSSTSPEAIVSMCSCASTLKVTSNRFRSSSSWDGMIVSLSSNNYSHFGYILYCSTSCFSFCPSSCRLCAAISACLVPATFCALACLMFSIAMAT